MEEYLFLLIVQEIIRLRQRLSLRPHLDPILSVASRLIFILALTFTFNCVYLTVIWTPTWIYFP